MTRQPHRPGPRDAELIAAWRAAVAERGLRVKFRETGIPEAAWSVSAEDADGEERGSGQGDTQAEALEVLIWCMFGCDPSAAT